METQESAQPSQPSPAQNAAAERQALIDIANKSASEQVAREHAQDSEFAGAEEPAEPTQETEDEQAEPEHVDTRASDRPKKSTISAITRARAEAQRLRERAQYEMQMHRQQMEADRQRIANEASMLRQQAEAIAKLRNDPEAAARALGINPHDWIRELANAGTPEGKTERELRIIREELAARDKRDADYRQQLQERERQAQQQHQKQVWDNARSRFLEQAAPTKYPHLTSLYDPEMIVQQGLSAYNRFAATPAGQRNIRRYGYACNNAEVLEYLESEASARVSKLSGKPKPVGGKTLSASSSNQRRTAEKDFYAKSEEDQRKDLIAMVDARRRK